MVLVLARHGDQLLNGSSSFTGIPGPRCHGRLVLPADSPRHRRVRLAFVALLVPSLGGWSFSSTVVIKSPKQTHPQRFPEDCSRPAPLSMGFSRQWYWSGWPCPSPGDLPDPGIKPRSPALQAHALPCEPPGKSFLKTSFPKLDALASTTSPRDRDFRTHTLSTSYCASGLPSSFPHALGPWHSPPLPGDPTTLTAQKDLFLKSRALRLPCSDQNLIWGDRIQVLGLPLAGRFWQTTLHFYTFSTWKICTCSFEPYFFKKKKSFPPLWSDSAGTGTVWRWKKIGSRLFLCTATQVRAEHGRGQGGPQENSGKTELDCFRIHLMEGFISCCFYIIRVIHN